MSFTFNIYVLKLSSNKYYVGKTTKSVQERFLEHVQNNGSEWTKLYEPIEIIEHFQTSDVYDEDKITKKYMGIYGIENVRGGSYCSISLADWQIKAIEHELKTSNDLCFNCGKHGHFASDCHKYNKKNIFNNNFFKFN